LLNQYTNFLFTEAPAAIAPSLPVSKPTSNNIESRNSAADSVGKSIAAEAGSADDFIDDLDLLLSNLTGPSTIISPAVSAAQSVVNKTKFSTLEDELELTLPVVKPSAFKTGEVNTPPVVPLKTPIRDNFHAQVSPSSVNSGATAGSDTDGGSTYESPIQAKSQALLERDERRFNDMKSLIDGEDIRCERLIHMFSSLYLYHRNGYSSFITHSALRKRTKLPRVPA
jgi:hypothetical protein